MLLGFALVLIPHGQQTSLFSHAGVVKKSEAPLLGLTSAAEGSMSMSSVLEFMSSMGVPVASSAGSAFPAMVSGAGTGAGAGGESGTASSVSPASPTASVGSVPEVGPEYGNVVINNHCEEEFVAFSIGAWPMGGNRTKLDPEGPVVPPHNGSWNAWQESIPHAIASGGSYTEPYRVTCPNVEGADAYCADQDKLRGQGISLKIVNPAKPDEATQFEYALVQNPLDNASYHRLNYDISLLDCADPQDHASLYGINFNDTNHRTIDDLNMSDEDRKHKVDMCPGYGNGLQVSFKAKEGCDGDVCPPIECNGEEWCKIYYFERTRTNEPSLMCTGEFRGDMVLDLCAGNTGSAASTRRGIGKDEDVQSVGSA